MAQVRGLLYMLVVWGMVFLPLVAIIVMPWALAEEEVTMVAEYMQKIPHQLRCMVLAALVI